MMRRGSALAWWFSTLGALAVALPLLARTPQHRKPSEEFGHLGEGLTSPSIGTPVEAAYRMFSTPDFKAVCDKAHAAEAVQLRPRTPRVRLHVGQPFALSSFKIVALDAAGAVLPKVPIAIESERWTDVLDGRSDHIADGTVTPIRPGTVRFRIRTLCEGPGAEMFIRADATR